MVKSVRDLVRMIFPGRLDGIVGSFVGLLTTAYLIRGDASPLDTFDRLASWAGIDIHGALSSTDAWLNASHRREEVLIGCLVIGVLMLAVVVNQIATTFREEQAARWLEQRHGHAYGTELFQARRYAVLQLGRFWAVAFVLMGVLAQIGELSWLRLGLGVLVIATCIAAAEVLDALARIDHFEPYRDSTRVLDVVPYVGMGLVFGVGHAVTALIALPLALWGFLAYPRFHPEPEHLNADKTSRPSRNGDDTERNGAAASQGRAKAEGP